MSMGSKLVEMLGVDESKMESEEVLFNFKCFSNLGTTLEMLKSDTDTNLRYIVSSGSERSLASIKSKDSKGIKTAAIWS